MQKCSFMQNEGKRLVLFVKYAEELADNLSLRMSL